MTTEKEIKALEIEIRTIFKRDSIPAIIVKRANTLIDRWMILTNWEVDNTPFLKGPLSIIDEPPYYQFNETRRHRESSNLS